MKPFYFQGHRSKVKIRIGLTMFSAVATLSTLYILQPILIKLSTQLVYGNIMKPIDCHGQRSNCFVHRSKVTLKIGLTIFSAVATVSPLYIDHFLTDLNQTWYKVSIR